MRIILHPHWSRAQGMVEYIIVIVVVGIFCIGIFMAMGRSITYQVGHSTQKLVGATHERMPMDHYAKTNVKFSVMIEHARKGGMSQE